MMEVANVLTRDHVEVTDKEDILSTLFTKLGDKLADDFALFISDCLLLATSTRLQMYTD